MSRYPRDNLNQEPKSLSTKGCFSHVIGLALIHDFVPLYTRKEFLVCHQEYSKWRQGTPICEKVRIARVVDFNVEAPHGGEKTVNPSYCLVMLSNLKLTLTGHEQTYVLRPDSWRFYRLDHLSCHLQLPYRDPDNQFWGKRRNQHPT